MGKGERKGPVSVVLGADDRSMFQAEARRRRSALSTTIRTLAIERAEELRQARQRERARRWQTERLQRLIARIESDGFREVTEERIEAIFERSGSEMRSRRMRTGAGG